MSRCQVGAERLNREEKYNLKSLIIYELKWVEKGTYSRFYEDFCCNIDKPKRKVIRLILSEKGFKVTGYLKGTENMTGSFVKSGKVLVYFNLV